MSAADYFRDGGFGRLMPLLRDKYISLSRIGGRVVIEDASDDEREAVGGLMGRVFEERDITVSLSEVDRALRNSRFGIGLKELLEEYFGGAVITRAQSEARRNAERAAFFEDLKTKYPSGKSGEWIRFMLSGGNVFAKRYSENRERLAADIDVVCRALETLGEPQLLPVLSAEVSGDPHMLDAASSCGRLFDRAIEFITGTPRAVSQSGRAELLEKADIYSDMVSSFVYCRNITLYDKNGARGAYMEFCKRNEPYTLNIGNLMGITRAEAVDNLVYIVENPAVFSLLSQNTNKASIICTAGQPKGAGIKLLRLLDGARLMYSGDFDAGGIQIANRLLCEFGDRVVLWRFSGEDYMKAISAVRLDNASRIHPEAVKSRGLAAAARLIKDTGFAGYQENIADLLLADIIRGVGRDG